VKKPSVSVYVNTKEVSRPQIDIGIIILIYESKKTPFFGKEYLLGMGVRP